MRMFSCFSIGDGIAGNSPQFQQIELRTGSELGGEPSLPMVQKCTHRAPRADWPAVDVS
jgi:hypothetical protein